MALEIERKFLVKSNKWKKLAEAGTTFKQGYIFNEKKKCLRVRIAGEKAFLTTKASLSNINSKICYEYEYEIPVTDAEEMLENLCIGGKIEKIRYELNHQGFVWEIDEFLSDNKGLVLAEIEMESDDQEVPIPDWAGEEVTQDTRYVNANLADNPYSKFKDK